MKNFWDEEIDALDVGIELPHFGLCMVGNESTLIRAARIAVEAANQGELLTYVEIGLAEGLTLCGMADVFMKIGVPPGDLRVVGVDIKDGWSLNKKILELNTQRLECLVEISYKGSVDYLKLYNKAASGLIHFMLIDGCHERECVKLDFLLAEPLIAYGGVVVFHDTDEAVQGIDNQPHKGEPVGVRDALLDLELLQGTRDGWKKLADIEGLPNQRGVAVFKRV